MKRSDWLDERIHLGEVPDARRDEARDRASSAEGAALQQALTENDAEVLRRAEENVMKRLATDRAQEQANAAATALQHVVTCLVTIAVVVRFEMVDVTQQQGQTPLLTLRLAP